MAITPTLSIQGTVDIDTPSIACEETLSAALEGITSHGPLVVTLDPGELNRVVLPPNAPATYMRIDTNRKVRYRLNAGTQDFTLERLRVDLGSEISQIEFFNDQLTPPEQVTLTVTFASGGEIV